VIEDREVDELALSLYICTCLFYSHTSNLGWIWKEEGCDD